MKGFRRNYYLPAITLLFSLLVHIAQADVIGQWHNYNAYSDVTEVEPTTPDTACFVLASRHLYYYNSRTREIETYDREGGLSGANISHIVWNEATQQLLLVYDDSNLDIITLDGKLYNLPDLANKVLTEDKTITGTCSEGPYVYLTTNFAVLEVDMHQHLLLNTYKSDSEKAQWARKQPQARTDKSRLPKGLMPQGPRDNNFLSTTLHDGKLYGVPGGYWACLGYNKSREGDVQVLDIESGEWSFFDRSFANETSANYIGYPYQALNQVLVDPLDANHVVASGRSGLYEFRNRRLIRYYNIKNSLLQTALPQNDTLSQQKYCIIQGMCYDPEGYLWITNTHTNNYQLFRIGRTEENNLGNWKEMPGLGKKNYAGLRNLMIDSRGYLWLSNDYWESQIIFCYDYKNGKSKTFKSLYNQNGSLIHSIYLQFHGLAEDQKGNLWIASNYGPLYITPDQLYNNDETLYQYIVPRNDGSGLGDYLLDGVDCLCIYIDQANRKWIGTNGAGVYVISSDNETQLHHFTTENSLLPSNTIYHIALDEDTGTFYFSTEDGLCSYQSDAAAGESDNSRIYCYPNPVRRDFGGMLTICNLQAGSTVTITDSSNHAVFRAESPTGILQWDMTNNSGKRVKPGIYMIYGIDDEGKAGGVCKVLVK